MGVYIKGMDMPKNCFRCPLWDSEYGRCRVTARITNCKKDCPLVEVKAPHGRLIDADAVDTSYSDPEVVETLREAPTIIEAEKD